MRLKCAQYWACSQLGARIASPGQELNADGSEQSPESPLGSIAIARPAAPGVVGICDGRSRHRPRRFQICPVRPDRCSNAHAGAIESPCLNAFAVQNVAIERFRNVVCMGLSMRSAWSKISKRSNS